MVLKFAVSKQEKVKDYPWVSTLVNSASEQINVAYVASLIKYGFCKKLLRYKWTSDQLNTFFLTFWLVTQQTSQVRTKVVNWSEVHLYRSNFLQNPYFSCFPIRTRFTLWPKFCSNSWISNSTVLSVLLFRNSRWKSSWQPNSSRMWLTIAADFSFYLKCLRIASHLFQLHQIVELRTARAPL